MQATQHLGRLRENVFEPQQAKTAGFVSSGFHRPLHFVCAYLQPTRVLEQSDALVESGSRLE